MRADIRRDYCVMRSRCGVVQFLATSEGRAVWTTTPYLAWWSAGALVLPRCREVGGRARGGWRVFWSSISLMPSWRVGAGAESAPVSGAMGTSSCAGDTGTASRKSPVQPPLKPVCGLGGAA